tara:strand:- start:212 stop:430 length:219 start_codon:yes stop_codon:yes gene_type:complete
MCFNTKPPAPKPAPARSAVMQTETPTFVAGAYDEETSSEAQAKNMMGKKALRIRRNSGLQIPSSGSGMQMSN